MRKPIRVLFVTENTARGGIASYLKTLAPAIKQLGIEVAIAAVWPKPDPFLREVAQTNDIHFELLAERRTVLSSIAVVRNLRRLQRVFAPHIVHTQAYYSDLAAAAAAASTRMFPILIASSHTLGDGHRMWQHALYRADREALRRFAVVIANSKATQRGLEKYGVGSTVVHPGISIQPLLAPYDGPPTVLFVGRLSHEKGAHRLPIIFDRLTRRLGSIRLKIVGDGPLFGLLKSSFDGYGVRETVMMIGNDQSQHHFSKASVVVIPSLAESFGLVALEAMANAVPVVASNVGGLSEVVGKYGQLIDPNDIDGFVSAIADVVENPQAYRDRAMSARSRAMDCFSEQAFVQSIYNIYKQATDNQQVTDGPNLAAPVRGS